MRPDQVVRADLLLKQRTSARSDLRAVTNFDGAKESTVQFRDTTYGYQDVIVPFGILQPILAAHFQQQIAECEVELAALGVDYDAGPADPDEGDEWALPAKFKA